MMAQHKVQLIGNYGIIYAQGTCSMCFTGPHQIAIDALYVTTQLADNNTIYFLDVTFENTPMIKHNLVTMFNSTEMGASLFIECKGDHLVHIMNTDIEEIPLMISPNNKTIEIQFEFAKHSCYQVAKEIGTLKLKQIKQ